MTEAEQRLKDVQSAITKVLRGGQAVRYGDRQVTRADLGMLRSLEKDYAAEVQAEQNKSRGRNRLSYMRF